jgi:phosphoribosylanthranilate isomerase
MTYVKICGMTRREDVERAVELGVSALGFILVPGSPRRLSLEAAAELASAVPPPVFRVAVMMDPGPGELLEVERCGAFDTIQFHGSEDPSLLSGRSLGTIKEKTGRYCHAGLFLLDSRKKNLAAGKPFDHSLLAGKILARPFLLAGGLGPENLAPALSTVRPFGVDLNSGVESAPGVKDRDKMAAALAAVKQFDRSERRDHQ